MIGRRAVNLVRFLLEDVVPPILRDSPLFRPLMYAAFGRHARGFIEFRSRAASMSEAEYAWFYGVQRRLMRRTDLNAACIAAIEDNLAGERIADIGCGTGYLIDRLARLHPQKECVGVDIAPPVIATPTNLTLTEGWLGRLPFKDNAFDTVICAHALEHVPDLDGAVRDLRRITRRRLIIVVPREREYKYAFNLHLHFFPYADSFLRRIAAPVGRHSCRVLGGDIYYREEQDSSDPAEATLPN